MTGPYRVISVTPKTVTIDEDGDFVVVSNDLGVHDLRRDGNDGNIQDEA